jgi:hypothetical protein
MRADQGGERGPRMATGEASAGGQLAAEGVLAPGDCLLDLGAEDGEPTLRLAPLPVLQRVRGGQGGLQVFKQGFHRTLLMDSGGSTRGKALEALPLRLPSHSDERRRRAFRLSFKVPTRSHKGARLGLPKPDPDPRSRLRNCLSQCSISCSRVNACHVLSGRFPRIMRAVNVAARVMHVGADVVGELAHSNLAEASGSIALDREGIILHRFGDVKLGGLVSSVAGAAG